MEQWEHMILQAKLTASSGELLAYFAGRAPALIDNKVDNARLLAALNDLGSEGWQLVTTETALNGDKAAQTYFLKRALTAARPPDISFGA